MSKIFMKAVKHADIRIIMQIYEYMLMRRKFTLQTIFELIFYPLDFKSC